MSLKNVVTKISASIIALYMVLGNFSIAGIGLAEVIAEDIQTPQIAIEQSIQKYVQYSRGEYQGAVIQTSVKISEACSQETYLPLSNVNLEIKAPAINGILPTKVNVITSKTMLTNGQENGKTNQSYDSATGLLNVSYKNQADKDGNIYSEYKENAKDEFEIIYIYSKEAYLESAAKCELEQTVKAKVEYKSENATLKVEKQSIIKQEETENVGDIADYSVTYASEIYKGYMYTNESNKTNYSTDYRTISTLSVINSEIIDKINLELGRSKYTYKLSDEEQELDTDTVIYKASKISEEDFNKLFGKDGVVDFYIGQTKYASIKYSQPDKEGNRIYTTEYYLEGKENTESGKVEYPEGTTNIAIETTKPQTEGKIVVENQKHIISKNNYGKEVSKIEAIKEIRTIKTTKLDTIEQEVKDEIGNVVYDENGKVQKEQVEKTTIINQKENTSKISLKEPTTQMSLKLSNNNLSTLTTNNITATIKLNDTNNSCKLFKAGNIELELPKNVTSAKITNAKSLYENGIKITNARIENGKVILTVEGKQTTYDTENISGGVNIVIDLELNIDYTTASHTETIKMTYNNNSVSTNVNIVSKNGLLMLSKVKNETKNTDAITVINSDKTIEISRNDKRQTENVEMNIVNNYGETISNVEIIGTLGVADEKTKSTYNISLSNKIVANKGKVLYSKDNKTWQENYISEAKYFKILLDNNELKKEEYLQISMQIIIPENLQYNEEAYIKYEMRYINSQKINKNVYSAIGFVTEKIQTKEENGVVYRADATAPLETNVQVISSDKTINSGDEVYEGQTLECKVTLKNNTLTNNNYKIATTLANAVYYEKYVTGEIYNITGEEDTRYHETAIDDLKREETIKIPAGETVEYTYQYVVNKDADKVVNSINILDEENNNINETVIQNKVKDAKMKLQIKYAYNEEVLVRNTISVRYTVQNYTDTELKNIKMKSNISEQLTPISSECYENVDNMEISYDDTDSSTVEILINKIGANESIEFVITYRVSLNNGSKEEKVFVNTSCKYGGDTYLSNNLIKTAYQSKTNLNMEVMNNANNKKLEVGDVVEYKVHITNQGVIDLDDTTLYFTPSEGFVINNAYIVYKDGTKKTIDIDEDSNSKLSTSIYVKSTDNIIVVYNVSVDYTQENMESKFTLIDNYSNTIERTSSLTGIINSEEPDIPEKPDNPDLPNDQDIPEDPDSPDSPNNPETPEKPDSPDTPNNPETPESPNTPDTPIVPENPEKNTYTVSGLAWLDSNKNGKRDSEETLLSGINVDLINAATGEGLKNSEGNNITTITGENGEYSFTGLEKGKYLVAFEFDTNTYTVTTYQKNGIDDSVNSDVIVSNISLNGASKLVGITDNLDVTSDLNNIDIGLIENANFDLSLDKQISKITVVNAQGTKTTEYNNKNFAKVDLVAKYMNNTSVIVTYKFIITNNGDVTGYVDMLEDNLPSGLAFSSELNKDWYKGSDGKLYTSSLSGIAIVPGATSEVELVLTKETTEETTGTFSNNAELTKISNLEAIEEKDSAKGNNKSTADIVISIKTGSPFIYIGITLGSIAVIAVGAYIIKKKVLDKEI